MLCSQFELLGNAYPEWQQVALQGAEFIPVTWETQIEFLAPGFNLAQAQILQAFGERTSRNETSLSFKDKATSTSTMTVETAALRQWTVEVCLQEELKPPCQTQITALAQGCLLLLTEQSAVPVTMTSPATILTGTHD